MEETQKFRMKREEIGFFKSVLESYEDIGIFSVIDGNKGFIELVYPSGFNNEIESIMADMVNYGIIFQEVADVL